ncbi:hypothetical protein [Granulicella mallensis]|uniref:Uncharacterized protein n=1 Tax=Granulicella mallensis TaxID=940614 RepID=A0A7W7ZSC2_9BACT|nr:hypothetical protein [Granulicella mallensis]MBB5065272.1 hypothetical protein [Granulicella mallensis]
MSTMAPACGAQQPGNIPTPFDWWPFVAAPIIGGALVYVWTNGIPIINGIVGASGAALGFSTLTGGAAGAASIATLVLYYVLKADGCIRSVPKGANICFSGIVNDTTDENSTAVDILAPFAMGPAGVFDVVVKSTYWHYVTDDSFWVYCDDAGAAMLPCLVKSETACGGHIGSLVGVTVGAIGGVILGYLAAAAVGIAIGCTATGFFYLLCLIIAFIIAAIVAAVVAYAGAVIGGAAGEGIAAAANANDPVVKAWKGLSPGDIVTVQGNWVTDDSLGNNEIFYTTSINRTGNVGSPGPYTTAQADDAIPSDDCNSNSNPPPPR